MKLLVQTGCWLLMAGMVAVAALYAWMMAQIAGVTLQQVMETVRFTVLFGVAWLLYERLMGRQQEHPVDQP
jgi:hypothetical protein